MTGQHQQVQQPQRMSSKLKQKLKNKQEPQRHAETPPTPQPTVNVDELAREKVEEVEQSLKQLTSFKLEAFNGWFSILKQIISAADLHRTNNGRERENEAQPDKPETGDSIYADYGDDNEQFNAHVDLSEQFATNSVKWTIRVHAFKIVHRLVRLLDNTNQAGNQLLSSSSKLPSLILERYLSDLVRLAFVAATSPYDELKMQGFEMFKFLIERFAAVEEKEFPGHSIMEQYKTQVLSAVKPAFNPDAPPYITAIASQICSLWICQRLEREPADVKRTYQLMLLSIEKLEGQSENQHSKLYTESELEQERVDILGSWAQLYIASMAHSSVLNPRRKISALSDGESANLNGLVKPQLEGLVDKWWEALKDYALLIMPAPKFIGTSHDNEHVYTREVALRLFAPTWPKLVLALSIYMSESELGSQSGSTSDLCYGSSSTSSANVLSPKRRSSKAKYTKFLCGILMKELSTSLVQSRDLSRLGERGQPQQLADSTALAIRSVRLLISNLGTRSVFTTDLTIAQEFHATLYGLAVAQGRGEDPYKLLLDDTLDLLYKLTLDRVIQRRDCVHHAMAKLVGSLMTSMKNIDIACGQKLPLEVELHKRHLATRLRNLLTLVKAAPQRALEETPLQEALIAVFQEMLRFDREPSVSLLLASQLESLYSALDCLEHRNHLIKELYSDLCKRAEDLLGSMVNLPGCSSGSIDKLKLSSVETFLSASRATISNSAACQRANFINKYVNSVLEPLRETVNGPSEATANPEGKVKRELVDYCLSHVTKVKKTFPDEFKGDTFSCLDEEIKSLCELVFKWQRDARHQIELANKKLQDSKKTPSNARGQPNSRPAAARITLKADFSNFYAKKV